MLDSLRKGAGTWVAKLFIALLIFSFAIWGVTDFLQGFGQNTAAKVGETEVSIFEFDRTYRQDLNRLAQQFGRPLTADEGAALGVPQQALGRLIAEAALSNTAQDLKLGVSDERLATLIQSDPAFRGPGGSYDRARLDQVLRAYGYQEDEYVVQRRRTAERNQLSEGIAGSFAAPVSYLEALSAYQFESRSADYVLLTDEAIGEIEDPTDPALTSFFDENKADFRAPEYREVKILSLTPETVARPDDIAEEDARYEYEQRAERYFQPERRKVRQMSFPSSEAAEEAAAELEGGKTFEDLMNERGLSNNDVTLGVMAKEDFLDETLGDTAFSLGQGEISGAVEGRFSTVILNVEEVLPESTRPYDEVKDEIIQDLAAEQAEREILDLLDEVEDARAGGALLDEIGERFSLPVETLAAFDQSGKSASGGDVELPAAEGLVAAVFESDVGIENDVLSFGEQGFLWYEVDNVIPERDQTLDEVKEDVIAAWKADQMKTRLSERAEEIRTRLEGGTPLETLAGEAELEVKRADNLTRNAPSGDFDADAMTAVFGGPLGTSAVAVSDNGHVIVFKVSEVSVPDFDAGSSENTALNQQLSQQMRDSLLGQFISDRENEAGVEINQVGIAQAIGLNQQ